MISLLGILTLGFYIFFLITREEEEFQGKIEINSKNKNKDVGLMEYLKTIEDYLFTLNYQVKLSDFGKKVFRDTVPGDIILIWDPFHIEILGPSAVLTDICEILKLDKENL